MVQILMPNDHMSELFLTSASDMEASSDVPRTELDSNASMVVLGTNSFVFESTERTYNDKTFSSNLGTAKDVPIVDETLARE